MDEPLLPDWKRAFREGFAPHLDTAALESLLEALRSGDGRVITKYTTVPVPIGTNLTLPVECACPVAFCATLSLGGFVGSELPATVDEVVEAFATLCYQADQSLGQPAACRHFLNWVDDSGVEAVRQELPAELERELVLRKGAARA